MAVDNYTGNIGRVTGGQPSANVGRTAESRQPGKFESILRQSMDKTEGLKFSKHAELRLQARNISLTSSQKERMNEAVEKAQSKGVKDSLILMDNMAFVVNVKNKTVITAANSSELKENVFTNIDGAVIV